MTDTRNPWVDAVSREAPASRSPVLDSPVTRERAGRGSVAFEIDHPTGPRSPQDGVPKPEQLLPIRRVTGAPALWIVGAHGGAGETSIAELNEAWAAAGHAWPDAGSITPTVVVARTSSRGLLAAQAAITQWAGRRAGPSVELIGLILIADAPGRLPRALHDLATVVKGGAPRSWDVPWIEAWRLGDPTENALRRPVHKLIANLDALTSTCSGADRPPPAMATPSPKGSPA